jgi:hypothetical protein
MTVPPLAVDGLTTLVTPVLKPTVLVGVLLLLLPLLPLLLHAATTRAAQAPSAASPTVLRLLIK